MKSKAVSESLWRGRPPRFLSDGFPNARLPSRDSFHRDLALFLLVPAHILPALPADFQPSECELGKTVIRGKMVQSW